MKYFVVNTIRHSLSILSLWTFQYRSLLLGINQVLFTDILYNHVLNILKFFNYKQVFIPADDIKSMRNFYTLQKFAIIWIATYFNMKIWHNYFHSFNQRNKNPPN